MEPENFTVNTVYSHRYMLRAEHFYTRVTTSAYICRLSMSTSKMSTKLKSAIKVDNRKLETFSCKISQLTLCQVSEAKFHKALIYLFVHLPKRPNKKSTLVPKFIFIDLTGQIAIRPFNFFFDINISTQIHGTTAGRSVRKVAWLQVTSSDKYCKKANFFL